MILNPYLIFDGDCREAFEFYAELLHAKVAMMTRYGDVPEGSGDPNPQNRERIMHARLEMGSFMLMGSDACPPQSTYEGITGCSVSLTMESTAEAERIFAELAHGADVRMPLQKTFWAERFAMLVDRFGVPWIINCTQGH